MKKPKICFECGNDSEWSNTFKSSTGLPRNYVLYLSNLSEYISAVNM